MTCLLARDIVQVYSNSGIRGSDKVQDGRTNGIPLAFRSPSRCRAGSTQRDPDRAIFQLALTSAGVCGTRSEYASARAPMGMPLADGSTEVRSRGHAEFPPHERCRDLDELRPDRRSPSRRHTIAEASWMNRGCPRAGLSIEADCGSSSKDSSHSGRAAVGSRAGSKPPTEFSASARPGSWPSSDATEACSV